MIDFYNYIDEDIASDHQDDMDSNISDSDNSDNNDVLVDDDHLFTNTDYDLIDNYVYFGHKELGNMDTSEIGEQHQSEINQKNNSQISFKGWLACAVKGCSCGGYSSKDSGLVCKNCTHSFAEHN